MNGCCFTDDENRSGHLRLSSAKDDCRCRLFRQGLSLERAFKQVGWWKCKESWRANQVVAENNDAQARRKVICDAVVPCQPDARRGMVIVCGAVVPK